MTESTDQKTKYTGCCGWDFKGPIESRKEISEMMEKCCGEEGSPDCFKIMEMFKDEDSSFDIARMMEMFKQVTSKK